MAGTGSTYLTRDCLLFPFAASKTCFCNTDTSVPKEPGCLCGGLVGLFFKKIPIILSDL